MDGDHINLYFIRHGETDYNVEGRFIGVSDQPLNENGIEQAKKTGLLLKQISPEYDLILTSPLKRAAETANIIAQVIDSNIPVVYEELLKERDYGVFEGKTEKEINQICPEVIAQYRRDKPNTRPPNGELAEAVENRIKTLMTEKIINEYKELKNIILVTHLNPIRAVLLLLKMAEPDIYYQKLQNAGVVEIQFFPDNMGRSKLIKFDIT